MSLVATILDSARRSKPQIPLCEKVQEWFPAELTVTFFLFSKLLGPRSSASPAKHILNTWTPSRKAQDANVTVSSGHYELWHTLLRIVVIHGTTESLPSTSHLITAGTASVFPVSPESLGRGQGRHGTLPAFQGLQVEFSHHPRNSTIRIHLKSPLYFTSTKISRLRAPCHIRWIVTLTVNILPLVPTVINHYCAAFSGFPHCSFEYGMMVYKLWLHFIIFT